MQIFKPITLVKNLPLNIECLSAHDDCIIIATKQGHLMKYRFKPKQGNVSLTTSSSSYFIGDQEPEMEIELLHSYKQFSKKPVAQVETVAQLKIIITLSDGLIHINNFDDLSIFQVIQKTKGASCFATNLQTQRTLTGEEQYMLRMCVVVKKKIILLYWKNKNFHEMSQEVNLNDQPKTLAWCSDSLFVGYRSEYEMIKITGTTNSEDDVKNLSATGGKQLEPMIKLLQHDKVSINRDENTYILDQNGDPHLNYSICWSDIPLDFVEDYPYLIALLPSSIIEIRTVEPHLFIQRLELAQRTSNYGKLKLLTKCQGRDGVVIAASANDIIALIAIPVDQQKQQMVAEKHFELALKLANLEKTKDYINIENIELKYAHDLFNRGFYKESLELFLKLDRSPLRVIELYPELSDKVFGQDDAHSSSGRSSSSTSRLDPSDDKIIALIDYLIQIRRKVCNLPRIPTSASSNDLNQRNETSSSLSSSSQQQQQQSANNLDDETLRSHMKSTRTLDKLKQEVDTTLLKCYLKTKNSLVASLLRLPDNHCKLQITEKALIKYNKYTELIILYQSRGLHTKALELLKNHFQDPPSSGHEKMVQYLQNLGPDHLPTVFEYASWVIEQDPELGLRIFTADTCEIEQQDRNLILEFLRQKAPQLEIPYLEHIIHFWNDKTSLFHTTLLLRYRQKVAPLLSSYLESIGDEVPCPAGQEPGELGELRQKLLDFLEISDHYTTQGLPALLLNEGLCEERAIVVGKLGQHEEALSIFIYVLNNPKRAEEYCSSVHKKRLPNSKNIFFLLLKLYLHPPETFSSTQLKRKMSVSSASQMSSSGGDQSFSVCNFSARIVKLLNEHGDKIDPLKAITELPNDFDLIHLKDYLSAIMKRKLQESHENEMFRQLVMSKFYQVQKTWIELQQANKIIIDDQTICQVCSKKIGLSAFVRFPNLDLVHYSCKDRYGRVVKTQMAFYSDN